jgi:hypothetical protein
VKDVRSLYQRTNEACVRRPRARPGRSPERIAGAKVMVAANSEDRHHDRIAELSLDEAVLPQRPFLDEAALLVAAAAADVVLVGCELDAVEFHILEPVFEHEVDGVCAVALVPLVLVVDGDAQLGPAVLQCRPQFTGAYELSVEGLDRPEDVVRVGARVFVPLNLLLESRRFVEGGEPAADLGVSQPGRETRQVCGEDGAQAYLRAFKNRL